MLQKVLKYDLRAIFKYWWILAVSSFGASIIGGIGLNLFINAVNSTKDINPFLIIFAFLAMILGFLAISAFVIGNEIFILIRYYRNFFTDEGYLTFTLPVSRTHLLNSKIISAFIANFATVSLATIEVFMMFFITDLRTDIIDGLKGLNELFNWPQFFPDKNITAIGIGFAVSGIIIFLAIVVLALCSTLLEFCCITIAGTVTKKNKVLVAIGIYYGVSMVISFISRIGTLMAMTIPDIIVTQTPVIATLTILFLALVVLCILCIVAISIYTLVSHILHKKLNLS